MIRYIIVIFLMITMFSCKPEQLNLKISDESLINIISDLHIAEEMVNKFRENQRDSVRSLYLDEISQIHSHSVDEINETIVLLQSDPDKSFKIYQEVYKKLDTYGKKKSGDKTKDAKGSTKVIVSDSLSKTNK